MMQAEAPPATTESIDCAVEPVSMNGGQHPTGCAGAVWSSGSPSKKYCDGMSSKSEEGMKYPWWSACCEWTGSECIPKGESALTMQPTPLGPTNPSEAPTNPSGAPTNPSEAPTNPSEAPPNPSGAPTNPSGAPTNPSEAPTNPSEAPTSSL